MDSITKIDDPLRKSNTSWEVALFLQYFCLHASFYKQRFSQLHLSAA